MRTAITAALVLAAGLWALSGCGRKARRTADKDRAEILSLEKELDGLRARAETLSGRLFPRVPEARWSSPPTRSRRPHPEGHRRFADRRHQAQEPQAPEGRPAQESHYPRRLQPADHRQPGDRPAEDGAPRDHLRGQYDGRRPARRRRFRRLAGDDQLQVGRQEHQRGRLRRSGHHPGGDRGRPARPLLRGRGPEADRLGPADPGGAGLSAAPDQAPGGAVRGVLGGRAEDPRRQNGRLRVRPRPR